ncbi:MAG: 30S ribosome-binding factor RbfA [bacterium]
MRSTRMKRIDDIVRQIVSEALLAKVQDPRIGIVTVTGVRVSPEFDIARVYVSVLGDDAAIRESLEGLRSAAPFLQSLLAKEIRVRRTPRLKFVYDDSIARSFRIDEALRGLEPAERSGNGGEDDEPVS